MSRKDEVFEYFRRYSDETAERVNAGIELNRKGHFRVTVKDASGKSIPGIKLVAKLKKHDFKFGANLFMLDELETEKKNSAYKEAFASLFNQATLPIYWSDLEPTEGKPRYSKNSPKIYRRPALDLCLEFCEANGIFPKAHCLTYFNFTPSWVDSQDIYDIKRKLETRYASLAKHYSNKIIAWEVINELLCTERIDGKTVFFKSDDVLEWNFKLAEKYFPNNELVINEASMIWEPLQFNFNRSAYYQIVERALKNGARIDTIGTQFHIFGGEKNKISCMYNPRRLYEVLDCYQKLNRPMQITEITIPAYSDTAEDEEIQAELIYNLYKVWFSHPAIEMITYWNLVDGYAAWAKPGDMSGGENSLRGGLLRFDLSEKPAYKRLKSLITEEWMTEVETLTDETGCASFKGFFGEYDIEINGKHHLISLSKANTGEVELII